LILTILFRPFGIPVTLVDFGYSV